MGSLDEINVLQLLLELVAVFLGVTLSFFFNSLKERRSERRRAREALKGIRTDLASEEKAVEWLIDVYGKSANAAKQLYHQWDDLPDKRKEAEDAIYLLYIGAPFSPARANYEAARSSGILGFIANDELRTSIANVFEQQHAYLNGINELTIERDFEFFRQIRPYVKYRDSKQTVKTYVMPGETSPLMSIDLLPGAPEQMQSDNITRNSLWHVAMFRRVFADLLTSYAKTLRELDNLIVKSLQ